MMSSVLYDTVNHVFYADTLQERDGTYDPLYPLKVMRIRSHTIAMTGDVVAIDFAKSWLQQHSVKTLGQFNLRDLDVMTENCKLSIRKGVVTDYHRLTNQFEGIGWLPDGELTLEKWMRFIASCPYTAMPIFKFSGKANLIGYYPKCKVISGDDDIEGRALVHHLCSAALLVESNDLVPVMSDSLLKTISEINYDSDK